MPALTHPIHLPSAILKSHTTKPAQNKFVTNDSSQTSNGDSNANSSNFIKTIEIGKIGILYTFLAKALNQKSRETSNYHFTKPSPVWVVVKKYKQNRSRASGVEIGLN